jgi:hypothetical protein
MQQLALEASVAAEFKEGGDHRCFGGAEFVDFSESWPVSGGESTEAAVFDEETASDGEDVPLSRHRCEGRWRAIRWW